MKAKLIDLDDRLLTLELGADFKQEYERMKGKDVRVEIKLYRKRRSLDSNGYAWTLVDKLASKLLTTKEEIYRSTIKEIGGVSETVAVEDEAVPKLVEVWTSNGLGWQADIEDSKDKGIKNVTLYYGSSVYDTRQMSHFIDILVQDCKALGIETMTPDEILRMLASWEEVEK